MSTTKEWISCADTAKLIRVALRREFPDTKFGVRSKTYSGGASIDIKWTDGPTRKAVEAVAKSYAGGDFDGMIDLKYYTDAWLMPDGSATPAHSAGTGGSRGVHEGYDYEPPSPDAVRVSFGADFVFCERSYSEAFARRVRDEIAAKWSREAGDFPGVRESGCGWSLDWDHPSQYGANAGPGGCDPTRLFRDALEA